MKPVTIRFPDEVHEAAAELATRDRRSFNSEVVTLLEIGIAARWQGKFDVPGALSEPGDSPERSGHADPLRGVGPASGPSNPGSESAPEPELDMKAILAETGRSMRASGKRNFNPDPKPISEKKTRR